VLGLAPLVLWNLRNDLATLDPDTQPLVEHPEWGYPQRVLGVARTTSRVLWGGDQLSIGRPAQWGVVLCAVALVVLSLLGVVAMVRWRGASRVVLLAPVLALLGLPVLRVMSLQVDPRYAVGWWPGLVVLVAAGAAAAAERSGGGGRAARTTLAGVVLVHLGVVGVGAADALADQRDRTDGLDATVDLVDDLRRCGVDTVWGDYWAVYPTLWASDVELGAVVTWGPERLTTFRPDDLASVGRVAVLVPAVMADTSASAELATDGTGRGATGWTPVTDPDTGVRIGLERTAAALPEGCLGAGGLVPVAGG
jgi:hypothetical protein